MKILISTILSFMFFYTFSQEVLLSKDELLDKGIKQNLKLKIAAEESLVAKASYQQTNAVFLPSITMSYTGISTTNPLMAFGAKLNQEAIGVSDFDPTLLNNPSAIQNYTTQIEINQPLLNIDAFYKRRAAKFQLEAQLLKQSRQEEYLEFELIKNYLQLQLTVKQIAVLNKALETAQENLRIARNNYEAGYLQKSDVLAAEVRVLQIKKDLQYAKSNQLAVSKQLSYAMNEPLEKLFKPSDSLELEVAQLEAVSLNEKRSDIKAMNLATQAYKKMFGAQKMSFLPSINAFGNYQLHDDEFAQADANGYLIGAQLSWKIFEGSKKIGRLKENKANFNKAVTELKDYVAKSELELQTAKQSLLDVKKELELSSLALEQSKESLRIVTNRFKEGLEKTTRLLQAETQVAQQELMYYQAIYKHNYTLAYLKFLTQE